MKKVFEVEITKIVEVEVDESIFTPEFNKSFSRHFYDIYCPSEHLENLAKQYARDNFMSNGSPEGYPSAQEMGLKIRLIEDWTDVDEAVGYD